MCLLHSEELKTNIFIHYFSPLSLLFQKCFLTTQPETVKILSKGSRITTEFITCFDNFYNQNSTHYQKKNTKMIKSSKISFHGFAFSASSK